MDHVVEVGGAGTLPLSVKAVRRGGHIALIGVLSGAAANSIRGLFFLNSIRLQGIYVGSRAMFEDMNRAISLALVQAGDRPDFPFDGVSRRLALSGERRAFREDLSFA